MIYNPDKNYMKELFLEILKTHCELGSASRTKMTSCCSAVEDEIDEVVVIDCCNCFN